jgi:hypothetical protein
MEQILRELSDNEMDWVSGGAMAFGVGPGLSNGAAAGSNTNVENTSPGGAIIAGVAGSGAAVSIFGIPGNGLVGGAAAAP